MRRNFSESSEIQTFFPPKNRWSPKKKKKKKKVFTEIEADFRSNSEIETFFQPKNRWSPKKEKKKVFTEIEADFSAKIGNSNVFSYRITTSTSQLRHPISFGGAVFNFSPKIGLKSTKNVQFCILHKPMGGARAPRPPPGYATESNVDLKAETLQILTLALTGGRKRKYLGWSKQVM